MTYLQQVGRSQRRSRRPLVLALAIVAVLVVLGGGVLAWAISRPDNQPAPTGLAVTSASASPSASAFSYGASQAACQTIARLVKAGTLDDMNQLRVLADDAADSADTGVAIAARILRQTAELAIAARGQANEAKYAEDARGDVARLQKACTTAGYA